MRRSTKVAVSALAVGGAASFALFASSTGKGGLERRHDGVNAVDARDAAGARPVATAAVVTAALPTSPSEALRERLREARALTSEEARRDALVRALAEAAEAEPASAALLAAELAASEGRDEALHETLGHFLRAAPAQARAWLTARAAQGDAELTLVLTREAATADPALGLSLSQRLPVGLRSAGITDVFSEWAAIQPDEASRVAAALADSSDREAAVAEVGRVRAHHEPERAFSWASALADENARRAALEPVIASWSESDPASAARAAATAMTTARQRLLDAAATSWAARDSEAALRWAEALPDPGEREATATAILLQLAHSDPAAAAERAVAWADGDSNDPPSALLGKVLAAWSAQAPATAQRWQEARAAR